MQVVDVNGNMFGYDHLEIIGIDGKPKTPGGGGGPYVPYTGATGNVDLGEYELKSGQFTLDTSPTGTAVVGTTRWNNTIGSSETTLKGGSVILKNGVDLVARVVNKVTPNATLTKANYTAVRISGAQGQRLAVAYAQADSDANSADTIGLVIETIATNQEGFVMTVGQLEGVNTTGSLQGETWADGDVLYLSPTTAGRLTNIKPTGLTGHIVVMGYVEYAHAIHGKIYVKIMNGWELDELHNVYINPGTLANNNLLQYDSADQLWKNESLSSAGIQPTLVSGTNIKTIEGQNILGSGNIDLTKSDVGLGNVDNTSDLNKPISTATQTALNAKQDTLTLTTTGTSGAATLVGATLNIPQYSGGIHAILNQGSGFVVSSQLTAAGLGSASMTANRMLVNPFIAAKTFTSSNLFIRVQGAIASSFAKILIYSDLNGRPNTLLFESANLDCSTTGNKIATTSFTFSAGTTYWLAYWGNSTQQVFTIAAANMITIRSQGLTPSPSNVVLASITYGSAPNPLTGFTESLNNMPFIGITQP